MPQTHAPRQQGRLLGFGQGHGAARVVDSHRFHLVFRSPKPGNIAADLRSGALSLGEESSWNTGLYDSGVYARALALLDDIESPVDPIVRADSSGRHLELLLVLEPRVHQRGVVQSAKLELFLFWRRAPRIVRSAVVDFHVGVVARVGIGVLDVHSSSMIGLIHAVDIVVHIRITIILSRDLLIQLGATVDLLLKNVVILGMMQITVLHLLLLDYVGATMFQRTPAVEIVGVKRDPASYLLHVFVLESRHPIFLILFQVCIGKVNYLFLSFNLF